MYDAEYYMSIELDYDSAIETIFWEIFDHFDASNILFESAMFIYSWTIRTMALVYKMFYRTKAEGKGRLRTQLRSADGNLLTPVCACVKKIIQDKKFQIFGHVSDLYK